MPAAHWPHARDPHLRSTARQLPSIRATWGRRPDGRRGGAGCSAEHAAATYLYLLDDVSSGVSGEVLTAAGGYVGRLAPPTETLLTWRDHHSFGPWSQEELDTVVRPAITGAEPADDR